jgi:hypothetical protein
MGFTYLGLAIAALGSLQSLAASPITYVESGQLSGTLGTTGLNNVPFTFTFNGDTNNITGAGTSASPFLNAAISNSLTIGVSNGSFSPVIEVGVNNVQGQIGVTDPALTDGITFVSAGAIGYNLATAISVSNSSFYFASGSLATTLGTLTISGAQNLTFTAAPATAPEPATSALSAFTLLGLVLVCVRTAKSRLDEC